MIFYGLCITETFVNTEISLSQRTCQHRGESPLICICNLRALLNYGIRVEHLRAEYHEHWVERIGTQSENQMTRETRDENRDGDEGRGGIFGVFLDG